VKPNCWYWRDKEKGVIHELSVDPAPNKNGYGFELFCTDAEGKIVRFKQAGKAFVVKKEPK
jgi:hypothetical protein